MSNPTSLVDRFAASLGWHGIERTDITLAPDICGNVPAGTVVTCWSTNGLRFFIQINQKAPGRFGEYNVSVVAERYGIAPMDFASCKFETTMRRTPRLSAFRRYSREPTSVINDGGVDTLKTSWKLLHPKKKWRGWKGRLRTEQTDEREPR